MRLVQEHVSAFHDRRRLRWRETSTNDLETSKIALIALSPYEISIDPKESSNDKTYSGRLHIKLVIGCVLDASENVSGTVLCLKRL